VTELPPLRIGIAGLGGHGRSIQDAVAAVPALCVGAVYDPDEGEARAAADRFGCPAAPSFDALLAHVDAVVLVTPNALHRAQTQAAVAAGLDVFVEKPIANTVADGRAMVEAADAAGRVLMVGHNARYGRAARQAKALVDDGAVGEPVSVEIHFSADNVQKGSHEGWRFQPGQCPLLPMMQLGIHAVDLAQYLVGPVRGASGRSRSVLTQPGVVDSVTGLLLFESGVAGTVVSNYCTPDLFQLRLAGTDGVLLLDWIPHRLTVLPRGGRTEAPEVRDFDRYAGEDLVAELREFAGAVRARRAPETDGRVGLQALAVVEAMSQSAQSDHHGVVALSGS